MAAFFESVKSGAEYGPCIDVEAMSDPRPEERLYTYGDPDLAGLALYVQPDPSGGDVVVSDAVVGWLTGEMDQNGIAMSRLIDAVLVRKALGVARYGTPLLSHNGRLTIADLAQEILDALVYSQQGSIEYTGYDSDITEFFNETRMIMQRRLVALDALLRKKTRAHWDLPPRMMGEVGREKRDR